MYDIEMYDVGVAQLSPYRLDFIIQPGYVQDTAGIRIIGTLDKNLQKRLYLVKNTDNLCCKMLEPPQSLFLQHTDKDLSPLCTEAHPLSNIHIQSLTPSVTYHTPTHTLGVDSVQLQKHRRSKAHTNTARCQMVTCYIPTDRQAVETKIDNQRT